MPLFMKYSVFTLLFVVLLSALSYWVFEMPVFAGCSRQECENRGVCYRGDTAVYCIKVPAGLDTMAFSANIALDTARRIHRIKMPNGGTETNVRVYDSTFLTTRLSPSQNTAAALAAGDFSMQEEVLLDVTDLTPGKYYVQYTSCNMGGVFPLTIE